MQYLHEFLILAVVHFLAVVSPGPDFAVVIQQSISHGRRTGIMNALGIGAGISVHVLYTILGFGLVIQAYPWLLSIVKVLAAAYLLYLAYQLIVSNLKPQQGTVDKQMAQLDTEKSTHMHDAVQVQSTVQPPTARQAFMKGFITNATNPKAPVFFLGIFTSIVSVQTPISIQFLYGIWMCMVNAAWFAFVAIMFTTSKVRTMFLSRKQYFEIAMGVILLLLALRLIFDLI